MGNRQRRGFHNSKKIARNSIRIPVLFTWATLDSKEIYFIWCLHTWILFSVYDGCSLIYGESLLALYSFCPLHSLSCEWKSAFTLKAAMIPFIHQKKWFCFFFLICLNSCSHFSSRYWRSHSIFILYTSQQWSIRVVPALKSIWMILHLINKQVFPTNFANIYWIMYCFDFISDILYSYKDYNDGCC